jgi:probable 2-oxoglutarate dehydrogenase E1 component DHKTD1
LQADEVLSADSATSARSAYKAHLEEALGRVSTYTPAASMLQGQWQAMVWPASADAMHDPQTGVELDVLRKVGRASVTVPDGFVRA